MKKFGQNLLILAIFNNDIIQCLYRNEFKTLDRTPKMTEKNDKENSDSKVDAVAAVAVLLILLTTVVFWLSEF